MTGIGNKSWFPPRLLVEREIGRPARSRIGTYATEDIGKALPGRRSKGLGLGPNSSLGEQITAFRELAASWHGTMIILGLAYLLPQVPWYRACLPFLFPCPARLRASSFEECYTWLLTYDYLGTLYYVQLYIRSFIRIALDRHLLNPKRIIPFVKHRCFYVYCKTIAREERLGNRHREILDCRSGSTMLFELFLLSCSRNKRSRASP
ncbi:hypothetical protein F5B20DRAFT_474206 [Whalleya microplaca]|nr:hypothetical protein F5B20DRAFT_474206 [Whalleya microplaca]